MYEERFSKRYGYWRPITDEVVEKYPGVEILTTALHGSDTKSAVLNISEPFPASAGDSAHHSKLRKKHPFSPGCCVYSVNLKNGPLDKEGANKFLLYNHKL